MRPIAYAGLGVACLAAGFYLQQTSMDFNPADRARCEANVAAAYGANAETKSALLPKCGEPGFIAMMDARVANLSAQQTAIAIANANRSGLMNDLLGYALIGAGVGGLAAAAVSRFRRSG
ncbi:hypothetical protein BN1110_00827 [bacterium YEK0313]|nr:hypothetical protein BN1110_00827 [bacterium YEK0313]